jgi:hypothetical protein
VVEYVLLLMVAVGIAILVANLLVSRNPDSPGVLTGTWNLINAAIGQDAADDITR